MEKKTSDANEVEVSEAKKGDYRCSHLAAEKGESYSATFSNIPYRKMIWDLEREILDEIYAKYLANREVRHLDFACGTGRVLSHYESRVKVSVGVDVSASMLAIARDSQRSSELYEVDITTNDILGNRSFDLITAFRFFPNAQAQLRDEALSVLLKHLDKEGCFVFNNHVNKDCLSNWLARIVGRKWNNGMSMREVEELMLKHDLKMVRVYSLAFLPVNEARTMLPIFLLRKLEEWLSGCPLLAKMGENLVFVCFRKEAVGQENI